MRKLILILLIFLNLNVSANDGVYFTSGNFLVPLQDSTISVAKEILTITIGKDSLAKVDVYYELVNPDTVAKTVTMAFEAPAPYNAPFDVVKSSKHPYIYDFTVMMNGVILPYRNALVVDRDTSDLTTVSTDKWKAELPKNHGKDDELWPGCLYNAELDSMVSVNYGYFFTAKFRPGVNKVHHTYSYMMSYNIAYRYEVPYRLTPAIRWANHKIDDFTLRIKNENGTGYTIKDSLFTISPFRIKDYQGSDKDSTGILYPFLNPNDRNEHITMVRNADKGDMLEWHAIDFIPTSDLHIISADFYQLNRGAWNYANEGKVVIGPQGQVEGRYIGENEGTYLIETQDFAYVPVNGRKVVEYSAAKGQGILTMRPNGGHSVNIRKEPSKKSAVLCYIKDVPGEMPKTYQCLGLVTVKGDEWYRIKAKGKEGYIRANTMIWDSIDSH